MEPRGRGGDGVKFWRGGAGTGPFLAGRGGGENYPPCRPLAHTSAKTNQVESRSGLRIQIPDDFQNLMGTSLSKDTYRIKL